MKHLWALVLLALAVTFTASGAVSSGGELDFTFAGDGVVVTDLGGSDFARDVLVQPDGKVVLIGQRSYVDPSRMDVAIARYNVDGTLDQTFSDDGLVTDLRSYVAGGDEGAVQPDGRLVVAGFRGDGTALGNNFFVARFTAQGALDSTFGDQGLVTTDFGGTREEATAVLVQPDGKIVVAGHRFTGANGYGPSDFALARYDAAGKLDPSFGSGGYVVTDMGNFDISGDAVLQADGKIVVVGSTGAGFPSEGPTKVAFARYTSAGALDPTLGSDGRAIVDVPAPSTTENVALQANGKLVALASSDQARFALVRITAGGELDTGFGTNGVASAELPGAPIPVDLAIQDDGRVVAAGVTYTAAGDRNAFALARFLPDGRTDNSFGTDGVAKADVGAGAWVMAVAIAPDGKLVAAGSIGGLPNMSQDFAVARFLPGTPPPARELSVTTAGSGTGKITSTPAGIDCGATCSASFPGGTVVKLAATPASGSTFAGWKGDCAGTSTCTVAMSADRAVTARFETAPPPPAAKCVVPKVVGKSLSAAKRAITKAGCGTGRVSQTYSAKPKGKVVAQAPPAGRIASQGTRVNLVVSKGRRPRHRR